MFLLFGVFTCVITYLLVWFSPALELSHLANIILTVLLVSFILATAVYVHLNKSGLFFEYPQQIQFKNAVLALFTINFLNFNYYVYTFVNNLMKNNANTLNTHLLSTTTLSTINIIGLVIIYLCYFVGFVCLVVLGDRFWSNNTGLPLAFLYFPLVITLLCSAKTLVTLFLCYELLLVPSLYVVYKTAYTRRAKQANVFFFIWTQVGSLIVLCPIAYLSLTYNNTEFTYLSTLTFTEKEAFVMYMFFFFGFGVKVPVWPLQYWLVKIHVEAPSGFSIFLSGFLVKSGIYCFFIAVSLIKPTIHPSLPLLFCVLGIVDSSLKFWGQTDIKKLIAYATVQEMNIIYLLFNLNSSDAINVGCIFLLTHGILSALLFYIVECLYRRTKTRTIYKMCGIQSLYPNLGVAIWGMLVLFLGFPGTLKFFVEFKFIMLAVQWDILLAFIFIFILIFIGCVGFARCWFSILYGMPSTSVDKTIDPELYHDEFTTTIPQPTDLTRVESGVILMLFLLSIVLNFSVYIFI